jgi:hypothetical protein
MHVAETHIQLVGGERETEAYLKMRTVFPILKVATK